MVLPPFNHLRVTHIDDRRIDAMLLKYAGSAADKENALLSLTPPKVKTA